MAALSLAAAALAQLSFVTVVSLRPRTTQTSRSPKDPRTSLEGPERWLRPLCVCCKVVVESRSTRAKQMQKNEKKDSKFSAEGKNDMKRFEL